MLEKLEILDDNFENVIHEICNFWDPLNHQMKLCVLNNWEKSNLFHFEFMWVITLLNLRKFLDLSLSIGLVVEVEF